MSATSTLVDTRERIARAWEDRHGLVGFVTSVDHKRIGIRYIATSFFFFFVAGALALVMRAQLARPDETLVGAEAFNQLFTMHGTTMIFLFNTPVLAGFGNYLLPLMIGARDMAYPRLNAFSYWVFLFAGIFIYLSFVVGKAPDGGWFSYVPLTDASYSPGVNLDFWGLGVIFVGISTTVGAVNFIVTTFKMRAPGMRVNQLPIFVWSMVGMAFMVLFAVPALTVAAGLLEADRLFGTAFFVVANGGSPLLYQHLFWFWGHPEVYILFLPATGMVSAIIPVFARRRLDGYVWVATSLMAVAFISFGVWVHHMFATGLPTAAMGVFSAASLVIALPSAILYFAWIGTMWEGKVRLEPPMLFVLGFLIIFALGGITGVMVSSMPFDWQATDTYFIVAHFHYVLNGAVVFPIFGALYFWLPKMTGRMLDRRLGWWSFWVMFVGFNVSFFPMHVLGLRGMPRRVYTYHSGLGWDWLNLVASIGAGVFGLGTAITLVNIFWSHRHGRPAGNDPWQADTLEWSTTSPPPEHNFTTMPFVRSRHPLWDEKESLGAPPSLVPATMGADGALAREAAITGGLDAAPESAMEVPPPTALPCLLALALALFFVGLLVSAALVAWVAALLGVTALARWAWRTEPMSAPALADSSAEAGTQTTASWGIVLVIVTEAMIFAALLSAYFFVRSASPEWPQGGIAPPDLTRISVFTVLLLGSSVPLFFGEAAIRRGHVGRLRIALLVSFAMGLAFLLNQAFEFASLDFGATDNAYASLFIVITGLHGLHLLVGLAISAVVQVKARLGAFDADRHRTVSVFSMYWHFVDVVWIFVFTSLYLSVHVR